jgi:hypothetical protein
MRKTMRLALSAAAFGAGLAMTAPAAEAATPRSVTWHINLFGGLKSLDSDVWTPVDSQQEVGLETSFGRPKWPVMIAADYFHSTDRADSGDLELTGITQEVALGVRKVWPHGRANPYLGGGLNWIEAEVKTDAPPPPGPPGSAFFPVPDPEGGVTSESDSASGLWVNAGVFWRLGPYMNLGLSARLSGAKVTLRDEELQTGGLHAGVVLGFGW